VRKLRRSAVVNIWLIRANMRPGTRIKRCKVIGAGVFHE